MTNRAPASGAVWGKYGKSRDKHRTLVHLAIACLEKQPFNEILSPVPSGPNCCSCTGKLLSLQTRLCDHVPVFFSPSLQTSSWEWWSCKALWGLWFCAVSWVSRGSDTVMDRPSCFLFGVLQSRQRAQGACIWHFCSTPSYLPPHYRLSYCVPPTIAFSRDPKPQLYLETGLGPFHHLESSVPGTPKQPCLDHSMPLHREGSSSREMRALLGSFSCLYVDRVSRPSGCSGIWSGRLS